MARNNIIRVRYSDDELKILDRNRKKHNRKRSTYIRERSIEYDYMGSHEMLNFLVLFINGIIQDIKGVKKSDAEIFEKFKLEKLHKPFDIKLQSLTFGMKEEEKRKFTENWNNKFKATESLFDDLKTFLKSHYITAEETKIEK